MKKFIHKTLLIIIFFILTFLLTSCTDNNSGKTELYIDSEKYEIETAYLSVKLNSTANEDDSYFKETDEKNLE